MARRRDTGSREQGPAPWDEGERTLADVEEDNRTRGTFGETACVCGSTTLVLQAFSEVVDGRLSERPLEMETLTCPECGREYEPVELEDGRVVRGDYLGQVDLAEDEDLV